MGREGWRGEYVFLDSIYRLNTMAKTTTTGTGELPTETNGYFTWKNTPLVDQQHQYRICSQYNY